MNLKLFVWYAFSPDYTDGLAFAIAENEIEARELVQKAIGQEVDDWGPLKILSLDKPIAFGVSG